MTEKPDDDIGTIARMSGLLGMAQSTLERNRDLLARQLEDEGDAPTLAEINEVHIATMDAVDRLETLFNEWLKDAPDE